MENGHSCFASSSSDGCAESGWTVYLEHSISDSPIASNSYSNLSRRTGCFDQPKIEEEEEVDLSMVSDASSGPRINFPENEFGNFPESTEIGRCFCPKTPRSLPQNGRKIKGTSTEEQRRRCCRDPRDQTPSFLDDTATSDPNFNFNSESSPCENQFNSLRQSSQSGNRRQKNQWFKGKKSELR